MRDERLHWHDHHMLLAMTTAARSPDPNTQVGSCIVDVQNRVISLGYNGSPRGIEPEEIPWGREGQPEDTKYAYVVHAERNAVLNAKRDLESCTLYATMFPCNECAKEIIQSGITEVRYLNNPYKDSWAAKTAAWMLDKALVRTVQHQWNAATGTILNTLFKDLKS